LISTASRAQLLLLNSINSLQSNDGSHATKRHFSRCDPQEGAAACAHYDVFLKLSSEPALSLKVVPLSADGCLHQQTCVGEQLSDCVVASDCLQAHRPRAAAVAARASSLASLARSCVRGSDRSNSSTSCRFFASFSRSLSFSSSTETA
jgi:hypothetical protein